VWRDECIRCPAVIAGAEPSHQKGTPVRQKKADRRPLIRKMDASPEETPTGGEREAPVRLYRQAVFGASFTGAASAHRSRRTRSEHAHGHALGSLMAVDALRGLLCFSTRFVTLRGVS